MQFLGVLNPPEFIYAARMAEWSQAPDPNTSFLTLPSKDALNADLLPFTLFFFSLKTHSCPFKIYATTVDS